MEWHRGDEIGSGSFSTVNLAIPKKQNSRFPPVMAVKSSSSQFNMLLREKSILEELEECPQIITCFGGDYSIDKGQELYNLFLEYATGGTIADKIKKSGDHRLPEFEIRRYAKSILEGVKYVHETGYVHCDLKLENILLCSSSKDSEYFTAKIADFGLATRIGERKEKKGIELRGTPLYLSPETLTNGNQGASGDVWAIGCMVSEMVTGSPAWKFRQDSGMFGLMMRIGAGDELPEIPENLSSEGKDFLEKIFVKDPKMRWTAQMLLDHPFIVNQICEEAEVSPRGPFDFSDDYRSVDTPSSVTKTPLSDFDTWASIEVDSCSDWHAEERLRKLVTCHKPDWSMSESWINVR